MAGASLQATGLIIDGCPWTCFVTKCEGPSFEPGQAERPVSDPSRDEERELVELAKRDPRQFGALYDRHFQQIYRFIYSRVREQTAAEDVTSEVFMKALKAMPRYQDTGRPFAAWLYQIAVNAIADRYRTLRPAHPLEDFHDLSVAGPALEDLAAHRDEVRRGWALGEAPPPPPRTAPGPKIQEDKKIEDNPAATAESPRAGQQPIPPRVPKPPAAAGPPR